MKGYCTTLKNKKSHRLTIAAALVVLLTSICAAKGDTTAKENKKRLQVEIFAGYSAFDPKDLNSIVDYDNKIQQYYYDSLLDYQKDNYGIYYWEKSQEGERKKLKSSSPLGLRLKYFIKPSLALSFGIKYFSPRETHSYTFTYDYRHNSGARFMEHMSFEPYSISAKGVSPLLGLHLIKKLSNSLSFEGYACGGLLFAQCSYLSDWSYKWTIAEGTIPYIATISSGRLEQQGKGTGLALELGLRINVRLNRLLGVFLDGGYSYQKVTRLSGPGLEEIDGSSRDWQGEWGIKGETLTAPWGELDLEFPTNYWPTEDNPLRNFELDLSGFQVRMGFFFRF